MLTKLRSKAGKSKAPATQPSSKDPRCDLKPPLSSASTPSSPAKALTARKLCPDPGQPPPGPRHGRASVPVGAASPQLRTKEAAVSQLREMLVNGGCSSSTIAPHRPIGGGGNHPSLGRTTSQPNEDTYESFNNNNSILQSPIGSICHRSGCAQALQPVGIEEPDICTLHHHHHHHHPPYPCSSSPHPAIDFQTRIRSAYRRSFIQGCSSRSRLQQQASSAAGCGGSIPSIPLHLPPPLHSLLSRSADRSLGQAFLVYRGETKRCRLPNQVTSLDTVRAMFVRAFPAKLSMTSFTDSTDLTIYTLDPTVNVFYELEDVREIGDMSVLKIVDRGQSGLVPLPVTVQSSRIHQSAMDILLLPQQHNHQHQHQPMSPKITSDRLSIYSTPTKWTPLSPHRPLYDGQSPYSTPYVNRVPNSPRLLDVDSAADQTFDHWPTSDGMDIYPRWSSGYICCPASMDETRMTVSDAGQATQTGLTSQYHHHHLHHSVAYLPASICCDVIDAQHHCHHLPPQQPTEARPISIICPSEADSIVQATTCSWPEVPQTGRTSPSGSEVPTEIDYDSRRRMHEVESRLVTLTTWLQNNLQLTTVVSQQQPEVNGRTTKNDDVTSAGGGTVGSYDAQCPDKAMNTLPVEGPGRKDHRVESEMQRTIRLINRKINGLKQEWLQLRDQNLERTRDVHVAIQDIRLLCIKNRQSSASKTAPMLAPTSQAASSQVNRTDPAPGNSQHENGNYCHVTNERTSDAGRSLQDTNRPHSTHLTHDPHSPYKSKDPHGPHQTQDSHGPHQPKDPYGPHQPKDPNGPHETPHSHGPHQTQDPYGPLDAIPPPAPLAPQPPDSPIWRRAEPSVQTPTRKATEPTSGHQGSSSMTTGHSGWTSDTNDNSVQNASPARNPDTPCARRNQADPGQWSSRSSGRPSNGRHYSSGGQWVSEPGQNSKEWSADDWSAVQHSTGRNHCAGGQWHSQTGEIISSKERSSDDDQEVFRSPGPIYGRLGPPPPPPPRRLSHSFVRETAKVFDALPQTPLDASSRHQLVIASRRVSMPGELRRPQSSSPARTVRLSSFVGHAPADDGTEGEFHRSPSGTAAKLNLFRSPTRLSRYTQDLATGIYSTFNRPDLQDQWLNVTDVETMRNALALQREIAANESTAGHPKPGDGNKSSSGTVGIRCAVVRRSASSSSSSSSDEDSSSASGDSQTTILRAPKQPQETENKR